MVTFSDEELVSRCKVELPHNTRSYELLVERHMQQVYRIVYRVVGHQQEAEDISQEVFLKAYNNLKRFEERASFSSWLYRIALNSGLDALDKAKHRPQTTTTVRTGGGSSSQDGAEEVDLLSLQPSHHEGPEDAVIRAELRQCISRVLKILDREQASVLIMRDFDGSSYDEIAQTLGAGLSAVKMRIHRARLSFQDLFSQTCGKIYLAFSTTATAAPDLTGSPVRPGRDSELVGVGGKTVPLARKRRG